MLYMLQETEQVCGNGAAVFAVSLGQQQSTSQSTDGTDHLTPAGTLMPVGLQEAVVHDGFKQLRC